MRPFALLVLLALSYVPCQAADSSKMTPVTRVVQLLNGLSKQIEAEGKEEEDLYEKYVCWAKTVIDSKTASNAEAAARTTELKERIDYIRNNPMTSEEADLTAKLADLKQSHEENEAMCKQQKADYAKATEEFTLTLEALDEAIKTLKEATDEKKGQKAESLLAVQTSLGFQARVKQSETLDRAVSIGNRFLAKGDALFLQRLLTGEVPKKDWKKLNRKSTYQAKYTKRSGKIQDLLAKLKQTFEAQRDEADAKDVADTAECTKRKDALDESIGETETALSDLTAEAGAKALSEGECQTEIDELAEQIKNDNKFIKQTTASLEETKSEWKDRQTVRMDEISAIAKAVEILSGDDAKDTFSESFTSQGYLFLQTEHAGAYQKAMSVLRETAKLSGDARLLSREIPQTCEAPLMCEEFDKKSNKYSICQVRCYIKEMLDGLKSQAEADLANKEKCEKDIMDESRSAAELARSADDESDKIAQAVAEMAEATENIKKANAIIASLEQEEKDATKTRGEQFKEWEASTATDNAASVLVLKAHDVLEAFYSNPDRKTEFVQEPPTVVAGEAPPPPPATWKNPTYTGKQEENTGILAILNMINEDILKDIAEAKTAEDNQKKAYDDHIAEIAQDIKDQDAIIVDQTAQHTTAEGNKNAADVARSGDAKQLAIHLTTLENIHDDCRYIALNFPLRKKNRDIEMDGLKKANAILTGAAFDAPDPNREIKPGDAFLQRHKF